MKRGRRKGRRYKINEGRENERKCRRGEKAEEFLVTCKFLGQIGFAKLFILSVFSHMLHTMHSMKL